MKHDVIQYYVRYEYLVIGDYCKCLKKIYVFFFSRKVDVVCNHVIIYVPCTYSKDSIVLTFRVSIPLQCPALQLKYY